MITLHPVAPTLAVRCTHAFKPPAGSEPQVDALWAAAQAESPWLFDGDVFNLTSHAAETIEGCLVPYRYWIAGRRDPALGARLGLRPLAVTGITHIAGGIVLGRRSHRITQDAGLWELAPAGSLSGPADDETGDVNVRAQLLEEMHEELGVGADMIASVEAPRTLAEDRTVGVFDIVRPVHLSATRAEFDAAFATRTSDEVSEILILDEHARKAFLAQEPDRIAPVSRAILEALAAPS